MLADIGLIVGLYALMRLAWVLRVEATDPALLRSVWSRALIAATVLVMIAIALFTLDIFLIGTDWLAEETEALR